MKRVLSSQLEILAYLDAVLLKLDVRLFWFTELGLGIALAPGFVGLALTMVVPDIT